MKVFLVSNGTNSVVVVNNKHYKQLKTTVLANEVLFTCQCFARNINAEVKSDNFGEKIESCVFNRNKVLA